MSKVLESLFYSKVGQSLMSALGVKPALNLNRFETSKQWVNGTIAIASTASTQLQSALSASNIEVKLFDTDSDEVYQGILLDATDYKTVGDLAKLKQIFSHASKRVSKCGHIVLIGRNPANIADSQYAAVMESLKWLHPGSSKRNGP